MYEIYRISTNVVDRVPAAGSERLKKYSKIALLKSRQPVS